MNVLPFPVRGSLMIGNFLGVPYRSGVLGRTPGECITEAS